MKKILLIVASAVMMMACPSPKEPGLDPNQQINRDNLEEQTTPCIAEASDVVVIYSEAEHQLYCGVKQLTSRIMDANAEGYAEVVFDKTPVVGKDVNVELLVSGIGDAKNVASKFRVLKIENDLIYIWSDKEHLGAVMYWKM